MGDMPHIEIDKLHPTQLTLGMAEVKRRAKQMRALSKGDLKAVLAAKPVPYVIGPEQRFYLVDHHHLCRALLRMDHDWVFLGRCLADWSQMELKAFWAEMEARQYCWPIDMEGNRRPCVKIPAKIEDLTNNPWRTLARGVRGAAYANQDTPFQEFMWGNYFRSFMTTRLLEADIDLAEELAVKVARLDEAQDLPGYLGRP